MAFIQFYRAYYHCKNCENKYYLLVVNRDTQIPCTRCNSNNSPIRQVKLLIQWIDYLFIDHALLLEKSEMKFN